MLATPGAAGTAISDSPAPTWPAGPSRNTGAAASVGASAASASVGAASAADPVVIGRVIDGETGRRDVRRRALPDWLAHHSAGNATTVSAVASEQPSSVGVE